jgi:hypothetical protein
MSDTQQTLERTFSLVQQDLEFAIQKSQEQKTRQNNVLRNHEQMVGDCLARAQNYYNKKEWAQAFAEWEKVCSFLAAEDDFRKKIIMLKQSHENLEKVNGELAEIKKILNRRSSPSSADRKFVQSAGEQANGRIRNVYSYLSQQLRTECMPQKLSFWWPVLLAVIVVGVGYGSLSIVQGSARTESGKVHDRTVQSLQAELARLQAEREESMNRTAILIQDYESRIDELKQQNSGWRNAGREKIDGMKNQIDELELKNKELNRRVETLMKDNLSLKAEF